MFEFALRKKRMRLAFLILGLLLVTWTVLQTSLANPIRIKPPSHEEYLIGGILPENMSHPLQIKNAEVFLKVHTNIDSQLNVDFRGLYYITNINSTDSFSIAAPFSSVFENLPKTIQIRVNGTIIPHDLYDSNYTEPTEWELYLDPSIRVFAVTNISFEKDKVTIVEYSWDSTIDSSSDYTYVKYDIGTGRAWNDTVNERIEFKVKGPQPDRITHNAEYDRLKIEKEFLSNYYIWSWDNEPIEANEVGLIFEKIDLERASIVSIVGIIVYILLTTNVILLVIYLIKKRKLRGAKK